MRASIYVKLGIVSFLVFIWVNIIFCAVNIYGYLNQVNLG